MASNFTRAQRGRLPSHTYARVRDHLLKIAATRMLVSDSDSEDSDDDDDLLLDLSSSDSDSDSDEDVEELFLARAAIAHSKAARAPQVCFPRHEWDITPWDTLSPGEFEWWTLFAPDDFDELVDELTSLPAEIQTPSRKHRPCARKLAVAIVLWRLAGSDIARPWRTIAMRFHIDESYLSNIFAVTVTLLGASFRVLATNLDVCRLLKRCDDFADAGARLGASVWPIAAIPDGKQNRTTRPHRSAGDHVQEAFYQGRTHSHGINIHALVFLDGSFVTYVGSAAANDLSLFEESEQMVAFEFLETSAGVKMMALGDQAYCGFPSASLTARPRGTISKRRRKWWRRNNRVRAMVEVNFAVLVRLFPFLNHRTQLKLQRKTQYNLRDLVTTATILGNAYNCLHGSQVTATTRVDPPSLKEYFRNHHRQLIPDLNGS
jgi:muconolactone delta-isomerase